MRHVIIIVPLFFLLLAILYLFTPVFPGPIAHEAFIDEKVQILISQYDFEKRLKELSRSPIGKAIDGLDYPLISRELGLSADQTSQILHLKEEIARGLQDPLLLTLFGSEASIALFGFTPTEDEPLQNQFLDHLLFISRPKHSARLMDFAGWFGIGQDRVGESRYGGHLIKRFDVEQDRRISAARVKNLLVFSFNEQLLRDSLDIYDNKEHALRDTAGYRKRKKSFAGASLFCYLNFANLAEHVETFGAAPLMIDQGLVFDGADLFSGYRYGFFGAWRKNDIIVDKAMISFDPELIDRQATQSATRPASVPDSFTRVSSDTILYYWTNNFDLDSTLSMLGGTDQTKAERLNGVLAELVEIAGVVPDDLNALLGQEVMLAVKGIGKNQLIPLPLFLLAIKGGDMAKLQAAVEKLIDYYRIPVRRNEVGGSEVVTWGGVVGMGTVQPSLSFADDTMIVSSNRAQITDYLSLEGGGGDSLDKNITFMQLERELMQPSNFITYLDFAETITNVKQMVSWGATMAAIKDRETARRSKVLIDELIDPVLDGLSMYSVIGSRKYLEGDTIVFESTTLLDHGRHGK